jgi:demethylmenaquinone methyltransferase/2-methoxy-6-polyprenyl-1,4-benzoquinol methylase
MLQVGRRAAHEGVELVAGDALSLPFADDSFDAVTISFGLRNTADVDRALEEMLRVTRPGGRLVVCEFSHPTWAPFRTLYVEYLMKALPTVATRVSSDPAAYVYLAESIRAWPVQAQLARQLQRAGWASVGWRNLSGGIVRAAPGDEAEQLAEPARRPARASPPRPAGRPSRAAGPPRPSAQDPYRRTLL